MSVEPGHPAPPFRLADAEGQIHTLSDYHGKTVVLYFYPKDDTPGCTKEACGFRDLHEQFTDHEVVVLGVSPDGVEKHCKFAEKHGLGFELLADTEHAVAEQYGVWVEKSMYGKKYMGMQRATFLIDEQGKVAQVWPKVKPAGHAKQVLDALG